LAGNSSAHTSAPSPIWNSPVAAGYLRARTSASRYTLKTTRKMPKSAGASECDQLGGARPNSSPPAQKESSALATSST
jgi:hypothetical protein